MIGVGIGLPFFKSFGGIDAQAQAHFNRVIADGGLVPSGLSGVNAFFKTIKAIYGTSDINTAISVGLDSQVLGYKLGAGSGTTLGQAAQKLYSPKDVFGGIGTGSAFWEGVGVAGNFVSTPNAAANQITGDIEIIGKKIKLLDYTNTYAIASKGDTASNRGWVLRSNAGTLAFLVSYNGTSSESITATTDLTSAGYVLGTEYYFKVTRVSSTGSVSFYGSSDGVTYTQIGSSVIGTTGASFNSTGLVYVGNWGNALNNFAGKIGGVTISSTIGGTPVVDFNPNQYTGANTWTSTTSEVWTVNRTGAGLADVVQTTAASQPLLLVHSGANYFFGSGVVQNYCSTSITVLSSTTTDFEIKAQINLQNYSSNGYSIVGQYVAGNNNFLLFIRDGILEIYFVVAGTGYSYNSTVAVGFTNNTDGYIKVTRDSATGAVKYYISTDGSTYAQLGATVSGVNGAITPPTTSTLQVGMYENINGAFQGKIYRATISNSIGGAPVVDFNPTSYNAATSQTQWTSSTGEVWTINTGTATTGYKGVLVDRTITMADGIDDTMVQSTANRGDICTQYAAVKYAAVTTAGASFIDSQSHASYNAISWLDSTTIRTYFENATVIDRTVVAQTLNLITITNTNAAQTGSINNGTNGTNTQNPSTSKTGVTLFGNGAEGAKQQGFLNTYVCSNSINDSTNRTAMYNYIRSINNSAF
jgi:hypothetical protein